MTLRSIVVVVGKTIINCPHCEGVCRIGKAVILITVDDITGFLCPTENEDYPCLECDRMVCEDVDDEFGLPIAFDSKEDAEHRVDYLLELWDTDPETFLTTISIVPEDGCEQYKLQ